MVATLRTRSGHLRAKKMLYDTVRIVPQYLESTTMIFRSGCSHEQSSYRHASGRAAHEYWSPPKVGKKTFDYPRA